MSFPLQGPPQHPTAARKALVGPPGGVIVVLNPLRCLLPPPRGEEGANVRERRRDHVLPPQREDLPLRPSLQLGPDRPRGVQNAVAYALAPQPPQRPVPLLLRQPRGVCLDLRHRPLQVLPSADAVALEAPPELLHSDALEDPAVVAAPKLRVQLPILLHHPPRHHPVHPCRQKGAQRPVLGVQEEHARVVDQSAALGGRAAPLLPEQLAWRHPRLLEDLKVAPHPTLVVRVDSRGHRGVHPPQPLVVRLPLRRVRSRPARVLGCGRRKAEFALLDDFGGVVPPAEEGLRVVVGPAAQDGELATAPRGLQRLPRPHSKVPSGEVLVGGSESDQPVRHPGHLLLARLVGRHGAALVALQRVAVHDLAPKAQATEDLGRELDRSLGLPRSRGAQHHDDLLHRTIVAVDSSVAVTTPFVLAHHPLPLAPRSRLCR